MYQHNSTSKLVKNYYQRVFLDVDSGYKIRLAFKTTYTIFYSQVLLAGRLTRSYFNSDTVAFKLFQIAFKLLSC